MVKETKFAKVLGKYISETILELDSKKKHVETKRVSSSHDPIINFQKGKKGSIPLYCIPGAGGSIGRLVGLTNHFDSINPIFGVVPRGLEDDSVPHVTVEAAAKYYLEKICFAKPHGSYNLLGHSYGGWVALEMANQVVARGETVESLVLLDTMLPSSQLEMVKDNPRLYALQRLVEILEMQSSCIFNIKLEEIINWPEERQIQTIREQMIDMKIMPNSTNISDVRRLVQLFIINANTIYNPSGIYDGKVLLVQANEECSTDKNEKGWEKYLSNFEIIVSQGNHMSMLENPYAIELAQSIMSFTTIR